MQGAISHLLRHPRYLDFQFYLFSKRPLIQMLHRCQCWEKDMEIKEMKEQFKELMNLLRQSETRRKEVEKELIHREEAIAIALATAASVLLQRYLTK